MTRWLSPLLQKLTVAQRQSAFGRLELYVLHFQPVMVMCHHSAVVGGDRKDSSKWKPEGHGLASVFAQANLHNLQVSQNSFRSWLFLGQPRFRRDQGLRQNATATITVLTRPPLPP